MTISESGSIGELIGSIAVLVTAIHLAIQVHMAPAEGAAATIKDRGSAMRDVIAPTDLRRSIR